MNVKLHNLKATQTLACKLADQAQPGDVVLLSGILGSGKTSFARAFIQHLSNATPDVTSPTFNLIQTYATTKGELWHCDLYRLEDEDELYNLGLEEMLGNVITLVEWPDMIRPMLPNNALEISFAIESEDARTATLTAHGTWHERLAA